MDFETKTEDAWKVEICENKECNVDLTKSVKYTVYERDGKMHIVCLDCHVNFYVEMKELYPDELDIPHSYYLHNQHLHS